MHNTHKGTAMYSIKSSKSEFIFQHTSDKGKGKSNFANKQNLIPDTHQYTVNVTGIIILIHGLNSHVRFSFLRHNIHIMDNEKAVSKDGKNYCINEDS
ncbi:hypothetical protein C922_05798 [Plasmodium inui San Antonio 1]|uniref:Uncharacterized protein n=1 Tax=Plasmodium inui San Antonio 1 TaxID=1237626 RepID=W6ZWZ6_9APIC|nr:hypothetical protein C922_05798 [Plasmodium inui San Antonio 1]EUD63823.1 hypothetical protein C922_05798 [Plasmodium inui San Antonio 1]